MISHPNRSKYRYFWVCPRGFANEITYYRVTEDRVPEIDSHFAGRKDRKFDLGNTNWDWGWTDSRRSRMGGTAIDWDDATDEARTIERAMHRNEAAD